MIDLNHVVNLAITAKGKNSEEKKREKFKGEISQI